MPLKMPLGNSLFFFWENDGIMSAEKRRKAEGEGILPLAVKKPYALRIAEQRDRRKTKFFGGSASERNNVLEKRRGEGILPLAVKKPYALRFAEQRDRRKTRFFGGSASIWYNT